MSETREEIARILARRRRAGGTDGEPGKADAGEGATLSPARFRRSGAASATRGPEKVGEVLARVLKRRGLDQELEYQRVLEDWPRLVGSGLARVTRARSVRNGVLVVEVPSSAWAMELNLRRRRIMARLNAGRSVRVRRVIFVLSGGDEKGREW